MLIVRKFCEFSDILSRINNNFIIIVNCILFVMNLYEIYIVFSMFIFLILVLFYIICSY